MHKTRLTQNNKPKHISNAKTKIREKERKRERERERERRRRRRRRSDIITWSPFPFTPWKNLSI